MTHPPRSYDPTRTRRAPSPPAAGGERWAAPAALLISIGCASPPDRSVSDTATAHAIGDSILDWNRTASLDESIPRFAGDGLGLEMANASVGGATILGEADTIAQQYVSRAWDLVVLDGGGNDIGDGCDREVIDELASEDGATGATVELIDRMVNDGAAWVVLLGYYGMPEDGEFAPCVPELELLESRYATLADRYPTVFFVDPSAVIDGTSLADFDPDLLHPSVSGGRKVADLIVGVVRDVRSTN